MSPGQGAIFRRRKFVAGPSYNAMQEFFRNRNVLRTFSRTADAATALAASFALLFFRNAGEELDQSELRSHSTNK